MGWRVVFEDTLTVSLQNDKVHARYGITLTE